MWYQVEIEACPRDIVDALSETLDEYQALSVSLSDSFDDPILEPELDTTPLWPGVTIVALFDDAAVAKLALTDLQKAYPSLAMRIVELADENWLERCKAHCKPLSFGERLWVYPSWEDIPALNASKACVILDPGLAFGTGTHPTTELCLRWLDKTKLEHKTLIDYGAGSGILSLAAIKLHADRVYAVDIDPQALRAIQNNAENNQILPGQIIVDYPESLSEPVDIILANILLNPLLSLKNNFHKLLKEEGTLVLSGILNEQAKELIEAYQDLFQFQESYDKDGWSLIVFRS